ncbi:MAG: AraC family ethanolamine operon transcriptional activator [Paraglaciecola sp.]|jgi:AraC family ethanolamine operon transcriptional activator
MSYFECNSIEAYIDNLKGLEVDATQISRGKFFCQRKSLSLPLLEINYWHVQTSILYYGGLAQDSFLISFPVSRKSQKVDGRVLGENSILALLPDEERVVLHPDEVLSLDFLVNPLLFRYYFQWDNTDRLFNLIQSLQKKSELSTQKQLQSKQLIDHTLNAIGNPNRLSDQSMLDLRDSILLKLFKFLDHSVKDTKNVNSKQRVVIAKRALDYIHDNPQTKFTILELSNRCFCSLRTLEYAFRTILDITPKEYLIKRRLNSIKREIQIYDGKPINRIAMDYGVVNAGRFSRDYFQFFGEYPSETRGK